MERRIPGSRRTFVVQIHGEGRATVENVLTRERLAVPVMSALGDQIEAWLAQPNGHGPDVTVDETARRTK